MAKRWHSKHISTRWGIALLGFLLVSLILTIPLLNKSQDLRSQASDVTMPQGSSISFPSSMPSTTYNQSISVPITIRTGRSTVRSIIPDTYQIRSITLGKIYYDKRYFSKVNFSPSNGYQASIKSGSVDTKNSYLNIKLTGPQKVSLGKEYLLGNLTMKTTSRLPAGLSPAFIPSIYFSSYNIGVNFCKINRNGTFCKDIILSPANGNGIVHIRFN